MGLVAWITDLYSYFCYSHALDSTITGTQRQRRQGKLDGAFACARYKLRERKGEKLRLVDEAWKT